MIRRLSRQPMEANREVIETDEIPVRRPLFHTRFQAQINGTVIEFDMNDSRDISMCLMSNILQYEMQEGHGMQDCIPVLHDVEEVSYQKLKTFPYEQGVLKIKGWILTLPKDQEEKPVEVNLPDPFYV